MANTVFGSGPALTRWDAHRAICLPPPVCGPAAWIFLVGAPYVPCGGVDCRTDRQQRYSSYRGRHLRTAVSNARQ